MFSKLGVSAIKKDLTNTIELCKRIDNPQFKFRSVHVAGTNGKGSVSHMLAAILQTAGYKTGLYTSPHLLDFRERIRINGEMIPQQEVVEFVKSQKKTIEEIEPSFFEVTVAMAFQYLAEQHVDIAIIEVGLGGRLDSTNLITPRLSVITNIGYDHTNILGNTLAQIAFEKAGIIKQHVPVIVGEKHPETDDLFTKKAVDTGSKLIFASDEWEIEVEKESAKVKGESSKVKTTDQLKFEAIETINRISIPLSLDLTGSYQLKNIKTVLSAVKQLQTQGFVITETHLQQALKQVKTLTGLRGRWETLATSPLIICDTGHNEHGITEVLKNINSTGYKNLHMVIGMVKDKDIAKVLSLLPAEAEYYFCAPPIERAKPAVELAQEAQVFHLHGKVFTTVTDALDAAKQAAEEDDLIFVGGSTFVVAEVIS